MAQTEIPVGSGNFYRYEYDDGSGRTLYKGPVGSAPPLTEVDFLKQTNTIFKPARWKKYKDIVSLRTPAEARESVRKLEKEWKSAKSNAKKNRIIGVGNLAANRAGASMKRKNLSSKERGEFREIQGIYRAFVDKYKKGK